MKKSQSVILIFASLSITTYCTVPAISSTSTSAAATTTALVQQSSEQVADSSRLEKHQANDGQHALTKRNYVEEESVICIWDCIKQNTTNLLLFTKPGVGEQPNARVTKFSSSAELRGSGFNPKSKTYILVHGFRGSGLARQHWAVDIKDLILDRSKANVFYADWSHHARTLSYTRALDHIAEVAEDVFTILLNYKLIYPHFKVTDVHVIGHSLGGHIGGLLGQLMNGELDQISALDPPGFLLTSVEPSAKLSQDDAKYVIAYHTDSDRFGTRMILADRDVFFNGGSQQPNCGSLLPSLCDHRQATKLSSTYMGSCVMVAYLCSNYSQYLVGECGFCSANSSGCAGVGHEWQYDTGSRVSAAALRPPDTKKKKPDGDRPWLDGQLLHGASYFIKTAADSPYCMFTYQVVVVFGNGSDLHDVGAFDIILRADGVTGRLRLRVHRHAGPGDASGVVVVGGNGGGGLGQKFEVFTGDGTARQLVSSAYLFTGLALVDSANSMYTMSPFRFTRALLPGSIRAKVDGGAKVFVNFMSHVKFEERAQHSGPLEVRWTSSSHDRMKSSPSSSASSTRRRDSPLPPPRTRFRSRRTGRDT